MYIDTHSHLNLTQFDQDRQQVIDGMRLGNIRTQTVGVDLDSSRIALDISRQYSDVSRAIVGIHPAYITADTAQALIDSLVDIDEIVAHPLCVGVGECGYDFFRGEITDGLVRIQDELFLAQLDMTARQGKSAMLHLRSEKGSVRAYDRAIGVLSEYGSSRPLCQAHFYAGTIDQARQFLDLGCYISFTGVVTFARDYDEIIRFVPVERVLCETDSPYVAPVPYRGTRCTPAYVQYVYQKIAEIKGISEGEFVQQMADNVRALWRW
jgi:TatD DNase family protein